MYSNVGLAPAGTAESVSPMARTVATSFISLLPEAMGAGCGRGRNAKRNGPPARAPDQKRPGPLAVAGRVPLAVEGLHSAPRRRDRGNRRVALDLDGVVVRRRIERREPVRVLGAGVE